MLWDTELNYVSWEIKADAWEEVTMKLNLEYVWSKVHWLSTQFLWDKWYLKIDLCSYTKRVRICNKQSQQTIEYKKICMFGSKTNLKLKKKILGILVLFWLFSLFSFTLRLFLHGGGAEGVGPWEGGEGCRREGFEDHSRLAESLQLNVSFLQMWLLLFQVWKASIYHQALEGVY